MEPLPLDVQRELQRYVPQIVLEVRDDDVGLHAFLVVDSTQSGRSCGGLRCDPGVSVDQLKALARGMTLKYEFNGMRQGGAKAGLVAPAEIAPEEKARLLRRFGELIAPLLRTHLYNSGPDMSISSGNTNLRDQAAGVRVAKPRRSKGKQPFSTGLLPAGLLRPLASRCFAVTMGGDPAL